MKIAQIVCTYPPYFGGMGNSAFHLAEHLSDRGHDVTVYTPLVDTEPDGETKATVARVAPSLRYGNGGLFPTITHELEKFDLVHLHYPFFGVAGRIKRWKQKHQDIPLVTTYHMDPRGNGLLGAYMNVYARYYMPKVLAASDAIIASTREFATASEASTVYAADPSKWYEVPFGVDTDRFCPARANDQLRYQLGAAHKPLFLFVGGMDSAHHFKGISMLLKAMQNAITQRDMHLVLVGDGNERVKYESQAQWLGLKNHVTFVGAVSDADLPMYYATADCTVLPSTSRAEAFGMVLLESMASGTPVIATDLPGVRTIASIGGQIVPVNDAKALARVMLSLPDGGIAHEDSEAIQTEMKAEFAWPTIAKKTEDIYRFVSKKV